jgi:hypothetical protein
VATIGELSDFSVADLLTMISERKRSGRLVVKAAGDEIALYFEAGSLVRVTSGDIALRIGRMLVRQGLIDTPRLLEALHLQAESRSNAPIGEVLVRKGWITEGDLQRCLEEQSIEVLSRVMSSGPGIFTFDATLKVDGKAELTPLEPMALLRIAEERTAALTVIQSQLPGHLTPIFLNLPATELAEVQLSFGAPEGIVLNVLRTGPKTYPELSAQSALDDLTLGVAVITLLEAEIIATMAQLERGGRQLAHNAAG